MDIVFVDCPHCNNDVYCPNCSGEIIFEDKGNVRCPICDTKLKCEVCESSF